MNAQAWIALYAAVVSTGTLLWQATSYWHTNRPQLILTLKPYHIPKKLPENISLWGLDEKIRQGKGRATSLFDISIFNPRPTKTQVTRVTMYQRIDDKYRNWDVSPALGVPFWLEAGEEKRFVLDSIDLSNPIFEGEFGVFAQVGARRRAFQATADANRDGQVILDPEYYQKLKEVADEEPPTIHYEYVEPWRPGNEGNQPK
ncbi:hypothetical protein INP57_05040 [Saccharopolyspora sp. HNM0986]|uniref:hypothetical protein n=1 Tax=Saccharopolyspora galaxeae TaxID=2781241 RepID=UPI00190C2C0E|nr:hypothetical protein [Saccharopolyspora sp. HNM0986]MBK0866163.1 hypothetical protein [Saccharopolyspora sp. HNM0986]